MEETTILSALSSGDFEACETHLDSALIDEASLRQYFQSLFLYASRQKEMPHQKGERMTHPVVVLNSLKNLCSLRLDRPSRALVEFATKLCLKVRAEKPDDRWYQVPSDVLNEPIFVMDLLFALEEGERDKAFQEAAKISLISDNKFYVIELLTEACAHKFESIGSVGYAFHRAAAFCQGLDLKSFLPPLLEILTRGGIKIATVSIPSNFDLRAYAKPVIESDDLTGLILYATCDRLWNLESVKQTAFRQGVTRFLLDRFGRMERDSEREAGDPEKVGEFLRDSPVKNSAVWPVELAEHWLDTKLTSDPHDFVVLDSIQHLVRRLPDSYSYSLGEHLRSVGREIPVAKQKAV